jgi:hypothetical protein
VRTVSAIALKNAIKRRWNGTSAELERKNRLPIPDSDKQKIMLHLHACVVRCVGPLPSDCDHPVAELLHRWLPPSLHCLCWQTEGGHGNKHISLTIHGCGISCGDARAHTRAAFVRNQYG